MAIIKPEQLGSGLYSISGSFSGSFQGDHLGTASYAVNALSASYALSSSYASTASFAPLYLPLTGGIIDGNVTINGTASIAFLNVTYESASVIYSSGSNQFGDATNDTQTLIGTVLVSGSQQITGSLNVSGSTTQIGDNSLLGNTILSGSLTISGDTIITGSITAINQTASFGYVSSSFIDVTGKQTVRGYLQFYPTSDVVPITETGSYIYSSGSEGDMYFAQTNGSINNVIRLRWLEGNMYSGLLNGGVISTQSATTYQVSSGSGLIVSLNGSLNSDPYPSVQYLNWGTLSASIAPLSASFDQSFVAIKPTGSEANIFVQGLPYDDGQFNTMIPIGNVIHQNRSTINAVATYPSVAYGYKQRSSDFIRAFGPLKLSGLNTVVSGSTTGSLQITSGTSYNEGRNYVNDVNNPSYVTDTGQPISKIFRYYQSGSSWVYLTNGGAGFETIDPTQYSLDGTLTPVPGTGVNRRWSIQRVYYFPGGATKGIYVYYGNTTYASSIEAIANIPYENFSEAPNTAAGAILSSYLVVRNNADFTIPTSYNIRPGGLFRNVGGSGGGGSAATQTLSALTDVDILTNLPTDGQPLAYDATTLKWENRTYISASLVGNASTATTSSYALTSSYSTNILGVNNYVPKFIGVNSIGTSSIYNSGIGGAGRVGVLTATPRNTLDVSGVIYAQDSVWTTYGFFLGDMDAGASYAYLSGDGVSSTNSYLTLATDATERLRITYAGNVGIGTTTPLARLDVRAQGALSTDIAFKVRNSANAADLISINGLGTTTISGSLNISGSITTKSSVASQPNSLARWSGSAGGPLTLTGSILNSDNTQIWSYFRFANTLATLFPITSSITTGLYVNQGYWSTPGIGIQSNGTSTGVYGSAGNYSINDAVGGRFVANNGTTAIGVYGTVDTLEDGFVGTGIGGYFNGLGIGSYGFSTTAYSVQLVDGTEGIGKVLVSQTADGKANWAQTVNSASYALTASYALNGGGGGGAAFPYTGSAVITGSLTITGSLNVTNGITGSLQGTASYSLTASFIDAGFY